MSEKTLNEIVAHFGGETLARHLGVTPYSIKNAKAVGQFPASYFDVVDHLCREAGLKCPRAVFNFKSPTTAPSSEAAQSGGSLPRNKRGDGNSPLQGYGKPDPQVAS